MVTSALASYSVSSTVKHVSSGGAKAPISRGLICIRKGDDAWSADLAQKDDTLQNDALVKC